MGWRKRLLISAFAGPAIAGAGWALIEIGGYGPCGPASELSAVGAYLTIGFYMMLEGLFHFAWRLEAMGPAGKSIEYFLVFLLPPLVWSGVVYGLLSAAAALRRRSADPRRGYRR